LSASASTFLTHCTIFRSAVRISPIAVYEHTHCVCHVVSIIAPCRISCRVSPARFLAECRKRSAYLAQFAVPSLKFTVKTAEQAAEHQKITETYITTRPINSYISYNYLLHNIFRITNSFRSCALGHKQSCLNLATRLANKMLRSQKKMFLTGS